MVTKGPQQSKAERREAALAQALKLQEEQRRRERRTQATIIGSAVAGLLVVILAVFFIVRSSESPVEAGITKFPADVVVPSVSDAKGGISFGEGGGAGSTSGADAIPVDVYLDFMCPGCGGFERQNGAELKALSEDGTITLTLHTLSFLDSQSAGTAYSTRAASAFAYVAENAPNAAYDFQAGLFAQQPEEGNAGLTDEQIETIAIDAGVPAEVAAKLKDNFYQDFVAALTQIAFSTPSLQNADGKFSTPTVLIDGKIFAGNWAQPGTVSAAIKAAAAAK